MEQSVSKRRYIKFRRRGITQKNNTTIYTVLTTLDPIKTQQYGGLYSSTLETILIEQPITTQQYGGLYNSTLETILIAQHIQ